MIVAYRTVEISYLENSYYGDSTDTVYEEVVVEVKTFPSEEAFEEYKAKYKNENWHKA